MDNRRLGKKGRDQSDVAEIDWVLIDNARRCLGNVIQPAKIFVAGFFGRIRSELADAFRIAG